MRMPTRSVCAGLWIWLALALGPGRAGLMAATAQAPDTPGDSGIDRPAHGSDDDDDDGGAPAASIDSLLLAVSRQVPGFGGLFIGEDKGLKIYLTDPHQAARAQAAIAAVFGSNRLPLATAQVLTARYSFRQLETWHSHHRLTTLTIPGVVTTGIDKVTNRLRIGVTSQDVAGAVQGNLAQFQIPPDAVEIAIMEPIEAWDTLSDHVRPLVGGLMISSATVPGCTLGFLAVRLGQAGFVTASHCSSVGTIWHQPTVSGDLNRIGVDVFNPPLSAIPGCPSGMVCRMSDAAFLARNGGSDPATHRATASFGDIALPDAGLNIIGAFQITGKVTPVDGDVVTKVGRVTGATFGTVQTCQDIKDNGTNQAFLCQDLVTTVGLPGMPGDSGSVAFEDLGLGFEPPLTELVHLAGIVHGGNSTLFAYSPISSIEAELDPLRTFLGEPGANSPPEVKIVAPLDGTTVGVGGINSVAFGAEVVDYEGCCSDVVWTSDVDGVIGHGASMEFTFLSPGPRKITVTATDNDGATSSDSIGVTAALLPPAVSIDVPAAIGADLTVGVPFAFKGSSFDPNEPFLAMPCSALTWTSSNSADPFPVSGCTPQVTFQSVGSRTITLTGIDSFALSASAATTVTVYNPPSGAPVVGILNPHAGDFLDAYTPVTLTGVVQDLSDPNPMTYHWVLQIGTTSTTLGTGMITGSGQPTLQWTPSANVPFHCGPTDVVLSLDAQTPTSASSSTAIQVTIGFPTC